MLLVWIQWHTKTVCWKCRLVHRALNIQGLKEIKFSSKAPVTAPQPAQSSLQLRASPWLCKAVAACSGHLQATPGGKEAFLLFFFLSFFSRGERTQRENDECQSFLSCLFFLSLQKHLMALTLFLQDVAACRDSVDRYCIVMTRLIWESVDLGSVWVTVCDSFVWLSSGYTVGWVW